GAGTVMISPPPAWLTGSEARASLNPHLAGMLPFGERHAVRVCPPADLLSPDRLDVMAKLIYARARRAGVATDWSRSVYREHLRVWNGFREEDGSGKRGFAAYREAFDRLLDAFARGGFDPSLGLVPASRNGVILDGAHRLAAALAFDTPVPTVSFE